MHTIHKYAVPLFSDSFNDLFIITLPEHAKFLSVQVQHGQPYLCHLVDTTRPMSRQLFCLCGTGQRLPVKAVEEEWPYLGTFQLHDGTLIVHLFGGVPFVG